MSRQVYLVLSESPQFVVTLVHGTFARRAGWIKDDSPFARGLEDDLEGAALRTFPFRWSGGNSTRARADAIARLTVHLNELKSTFPSARHYVIGHSHGGAIAHEAGYQADVDGVVCLSTPFLILRERRHYETTLLGLTFVTNAFLICILGFLGYRLGSLPASPFVSWPLRVVLTLAGTFGGYILGELFSYHLRQLAPLLAPHTSHRTLPSEKLLIIRMLGDEASLSLSAAIFLSWLWNLVMLITLLPLEWIEQLNVVFRESRMLPRELSSLMMMLIYMVFGFLTVPVVLPLVVLSILPFGLHLALATPLYEISVEATPLGVQTCCLLSGGRMNRPWSALRHSTYESRYVQETISRWLLSGQVEPAEPVEGLPRMLRS